MTRDDQFSFIPFPTTWGLNAAFTLLSFYLSPTFKDQTDDHREAGLSFSSIQ